MNTNLYPDAQAIIQAIEDYNISFTIPPLKEYLKPAFYKNLVIHINGQSFDIPVCDEFNDFRSNNAPVFLQLVLLECSYFEEAEDFNVWVEDVGSFGDIDLSTKIYNELSAVVPKIMAALEHKVKPVSSFDMHMNTSVMQTLRHWKAS